MKTRLLVLGAAIVAAGLIAEKAEPTAVVDLATREGVRLVKGQWRYSDAKIVDTEFLGKRTYDYTPHAGSASFDDSQWEAISPETLEKKRGNGRLSFNWYRINVTVPERVGGMPTRGTTAVFETSVDDYAEVWVDGELTRALGQKGGSVVSGWNSGNRLVVGRNLKPGQQIQLAVFGANGPLSNLRTNFIYMRSAKLEFLRDEAGPVAIVPAEVNVEVKRLDPAFDEIVGMNPKIHKLAEGFTFTEGPVWVRDGGYLLFSDPNENTIYQFVPGQANGLGELRVFRKPSGYEGADIAEYRQPGSNGLTLDAKGRLTINEHGNRRVTRLENDDSLTVIADRFEGKRLNSPNDLVYRKDGALFFTDPFFGLPKFGEDPRKELPFTGVFSLHGGKLRLLTKELSGPNGIALSPDEKWLYVANWDDHKKVVMRYELHADATVGEGRLFFDMTSAPGEDALDGVKVDMKGNLYVSGPGGLWVLSPEVSHLGMIVVPRHVHNFAWGDDGKTLYLCARSGLYKMRLGFEGLRP